MARPRSGSRPSRGTAPTGQIRIISGQWRGRKLPVKDVTGLRPTTDRVKETVFNWLAPYLRGSRCLDLFAGSGGLAFEALSRFASYALMLEKNSQAHQQLASNLALLNCPQGEARLVDALAVLEKPNKDASQAFDIAFVDPPFRQALLEQSCALLESNGWLADEALIYLEREAELGAVTLPANWQLLKEKQAGQVCYQLYQRTDAASNAH